METVVAFCGIQSCFSEGASQPLHDFGHKTILAGTLGYLEFLGTAGKQYTIRPKVAGL